jgi:hypothetical protein
MIVIARHVFRIQLDHDLAIAQHHQSMNVSVFAAKRFDRFRKSPRPHSDVLRRCRWDLI